MVMMLGVWHRNHISKLCCDDHPDALKVYYKGTLSYVDGCWVGCGKLHRNQDVLNLKLRRNQDVLMLNCRLALTDNAALTIGSSIRKSLKGTRNLATTAPFSSCISDLPFAGVYVQKVAMLCNP